MGTRGEETYDSKTPAKRNDEQSSTHRSMDMDSESSTSVKEFAKDEPGRGPMQPA